MLKIDSAASTRGQTKYMKYVNSLGLWWWQHCQFPHFVSYLHVLGGVCFWLFLLYQITITIMYRILRNVLKFQNINKSSFINFFFFPTCKLLAQVKLVHICNYVMQGTSTMQGSSSNSWPITCNMGSITSNDCQQHTHNTLTQNSKFLFCEISHPT
jgi:hypothetical protein